MISLNLTKKYIATLLPKRSLTAHKGTFGKVLVIGGSENYPGSAYLSCAAAYRVGAGLVTLSTTPFVKISVSKKLPEVTFLSFSEIFQKLSEYDVVLIGPGLGQSKEMTNLVNKLLAEDLPKLVIDADGLNILSKINNWWEKIKGEFVLTPHPAEMARLTKKSIEEIQQNRNNITSEFSQKWRVVIVLKGANTVISTVDKVAISPFSNPVLATAGTGDILAGIIAGFLAQGLDTFEASCIGCYIHGEAGEMLKEKIGDAGALASDLLPFLPQAIRRMQT